jgi:hypothetical protein
LELSRHGVRLLRRRKKMSNRPDRATNGELPGAALDGGVPPQAVEELTAERDRLRAETVRLEAEVEELRRALAASREDAKAQAALAERWQKDWRDVYALLPPELRIDPQEIADMEKNGLSLNDLLHDIDREFQAHGAPSGG